MAARQQHLADLARTAEQALFYLSKEEYSALAGGLDRFFRGYADPVAILLD